MTSPYLPTTNCVVHPCQKITDGEYYEWYDGEGNRFRWGLCDEHLQLAIEMVECVGEVIDKGGVDV